MQNLVNIWSNLSNARRLVVVGATIAVFLAVLSLSRMATTPGMSLLYAGLDASAAGDVVRALDARGVAYKVAGDSIHVDSSQRDSLRMTLAAEGLPASGTAGYELLDGLSGFGTTSQMFDAAYLRAKEGELARTIATTPSIRSARVHLAAAPQQAFQRDRRPTASVTVTTNGTPVSPAHAQALRHMIAAAMAGMTPADVSVIDSVAGLIPSGEDPAPGLAGDGRAAELKRNIERLLAARVGANGAIVEVTVEVETEREQVTERRFDPQGRVAISSETEEKSTSSTQPGGDVTVASNLPEGDAAAGGDGRSNGTETRERVNYEVSETSREVLRAPGSVRRLSVAVLVDAQTVTAADGTTSQTPRSDEELAVLRELVASAAGIDEARGDVLTLKSLAFEPIVEAGTLAQAGFMDSLGPINVMTLIQLAVLSLVALILGLFVLRPLVSSAGARSESPTGGSPLALPGGDYGSNLALNGEIDDFELPDMPMIGGGMGDMGGMADDNDPMSRLRRLIEERQTESVEILRGWMEADGERN